MNPHLPDCPMLQTLPVKPILLSGAVLQAMACVVNLISGSWLLAMFGVVGFGICFAGWRLQFSKTE